VSREGETEGSEESEEDRRKEYKTNGVICGILLNRKKHHVKRGAKHLTYRKWQRR